MEHQNMAAWPLPEWNGRAPVPLDKAMLVEWLVTRHGFIVFTDWHISMIAGAVAERYGKAVPISAGAHQSTWPATWDIWAFVVTEEKRIRAGQMALPFDGLS